MDQSKRNIVFANPEKNIADMTEAEFREQVARPLAAELMRQRDDARRRRAETDQRAT